MKKSLLLTIVAALVFTACGNNKTTTSEVKDKAYWETMAEGMSRALTEHFWGANFEGYPDRYYFNYGSDLADTTTNHYWPQAHAMDVLVDAYMRTGDDYWRSFYPLWWDGMPRYNFSGRPEDAWWNVYVDDMEWIALAQLRMFETTDDTKYFDKARQTYNDWIWSTWGPEDESPWFGGITWKTDVGKSKNACSNGPAALIALRIYNLYDRAAAVAAAAGTVAAAPETAKLVDTKEQYLEQGTKIYEWTKQYLWGPEGQVYDNIGRDRETGEARIQKAWIFTYNQGTFLGSAHELYKITKEKRYLDEAVKTANYVIDSMSNNGGVLSDAAGGDGGLFHGIFFRYFVKLCNEPDLDMPTRRKFHDYLTRLATVMAEEGVNHEYMLYGGTWHEAPQSSYGVALTPHLSGCMLMEAMCVLETLK